MMDRLGGYFGSHEADDHLDYEQDGESTASEAPPSPVGQDERRMQVRAYNHWASLLGDNPLPFVSDLQPEMLDDFGPYSVLLDLTAGVEDAEIAFLGHELAAECGEDAISSLNEIPSRSVLSRITDHYMQILANQAPIGFEAEFLSDRGAEVQYRGILLPYSSNGTAIDYVYGVINWREVADEATADELLLEIDQVLGVSDDGEDSEVEAPLVLESPFAEVQDEAFELSETPGDDLGEAQEIAYAAQDTGDLANDEDEDTIYDLEPATMTEPAQRYEMPRPAFGEEDEDDGREYSPLSPSPRANRGVDALGNPIGVPVSDDTQWDGESLDDYDRGIKTAADYGLPDWDDEEDVEEDDVDGLVDPLSGEDADNGTSSLMSMVSRGMKHKKSIDLSDGAAPAASYFTEAPQEETAFSAYSIGEDEEDEDDHAAAEAPAPVSLTFGAASSWANDETAEDDGEGEEDEIFDLGSAAVLADEPVAEDADDYSADDDYYGADTDGDDVAPEGLYDALASARVLAQAALSNEDRSRKTLYAAVSQAYDFSLEADTDPAGYRELIAENGLTMQDRAPMTPIVKLVFGADYDKTRLTEYAAVLSFARREGVARGGLANFLRHAEGGVKGVVQAERKARREEQGKVVEEIAGLRDALAKKLRVLEGIDIADVSEGESEFALVMVRRLKGGALVVLGEVPEDVPLLEKAARKLLG